MRASRLLVLLALFVPVLATPTGAAATSPSFSVAITDLGAPGGVFSVATAINDDGVVVGTVQTAAGTPHATRWQAGATSAVGGSDSVAYGVNAAGQIVGTSPVGSGVLHPVRWEPDGTRLDLDPTGPSGGIATALNRTGQVVGFRPAPNDERHAFWWNGGVLTELSSLGGAFSEASGVNDSGQIVGYSQTALGVERAVRWNSATSAPTDLGPAGGRFSVANAINAAGQIAGAYTTSTGAVHAVRWEPDGTLTDLGTLGSTFSVARGINANGQVVGDSVTASGATHAFYWSDGVMLDLGTLGGDTSSATGLNAAGQVVGSARLADGSDHAVLWTITRDTSGPTITATATLANGQAYTSGTWTNQAVTVRFACAPGDAPLPAGACPAPVTISADTPPEGQPVAGSVTDAAGHSATSQTIVVRVDMTPPVASPPTARLAVAQTGTLTVPVTLTWPAQDAGSGHIRYAVEGRVNGGSYTAVALSWPGAQGITLYLAPGATYQYRARATDAAGNQSGWLTGPSFTVTAVQEDNAAISYAGDWTQTKLTGAYGGAVRATTSAGASATYTFTGTSVGWISTVGPNRGRADVYVDGQRMAGVDLYAATTERHRVVFVANGLSNATHTLTIRVQSTADPAATGAEVDVDGFVRLR